MSHPPRVQNLRCVIAMALLAAGAQPVDAVAAQFRSAPLAGASAFVAPGNATSDTPHAYIVTFEEVGLVSYRGGVDRMAATAPRIVDGERKLDVASASARTYATWLGQQRSTHLDAISAALHRKLVPTHSYGITQNGVAVLLTAAEAAIVANTPGVATIRAAGQQHLATYRGPRFIGANAIWDGTAVSNGVGTTGRGIRAGDLDTGSNATHPSFANDAACGFRGAFPKLVSVDCSSTDINGFCAGPEPEAADGFGHGVHTASTMAGNTVMPAPALPSGIAISGVAPCAAIFSYKVCESDSCDETAILAGIQNAISDNIDVLNFSISGGTDPWRDLDRDFLDAMGADIFVAAAAGNLQGTQTDPRGLVNHLGPWMMTVAASTQDQMIGPHMLVTGPGTVPPGISLIPMAPGSTTNAAATADHSGLRLLTYPANLLGCTADGGFPSGYFDGAIAVVLRGTCPFAEKISNAYTSGAMMIIVGNNDIGSINMDTTGSPDIPAFSIDQVYGDALIAFIAPLLPPAAPAERIFVDGFEIRDAFGANGWYKHQSSGATQGDVLASFSLRGPTPNPTLNATKPDITAPGVNIFAALDSADGDYGFMSGTSMATPHVTGAAALIRSVHPDWSVAEVKSALMMTATNANGVEEDGVTPWVVDDVGSGRVDLNKAALAGLTMDETIANFIAADPDAATPGDASTLNLPELRQSACAATGCSWVRTFRNRLATVGTWTISASAPANVGVTSVPSSFTLAAGATVAVTFTATPTTSLTAAAFGSITLSESSGQSPLQHLTLAVDQRIIPPNILCAQGACVMRVDSFTDGSAISDALGQQPPNPFLWLNRFSPAPTDYPLTITRVQTAFSAAYTTIGDTFDVFVYQDGDSDPSNGATLVGAYPGQSIAAPQDMLQTIVLSTPLTLTGSGDILVALVCRGVSRFPASVDNGLPGDSQRSWIGPSGAPVNGSPDLTQLGMQRVDRLLPGFNFNWIIRAQATNASGPIILGGPK